MDGWRGDDGNNDGDGSVLYGKLLLWKSLFYLEKTVYQYIYECVRVCM